MLELAGAKLALETGAAAIALFDKLYPWIKRVLTGKEDARAPSVKIERKGDTLVATKDAKPRYSVSYQDLMQRLDARDLELIKMYEKSMESYAAQFKKVYPQLATLPPIEKAQTEERLKGLIESMSEDLLGVLKFIQKIGLELDDHYAGARSMIERAKSL